MSTLEDLRKKMIGSSGQSVEYTAKMLHKIPTAPEIDREKFLEERAKGKKVLNIGCASGTLHERYKKVAATIYGVDKFKPADYLIDLDEFPEKLPDVDVDTVICGEVLEHLANPGRFLQALRKYENATIILTVPNAFNASGYRTLISLGMENVNIDHVAWYSWRTLTTLITRYGYRPVEFFWYKGAPPLSEGLIFVLNVIPKGGDAQKVIDTKP